MTDGVFPHDMAERAREKGEARDPKLMPLPEGALGVIMTPTVPEPEERELARFPRDGQYKEEPDRVAVPLGPRVLVEPMTEPTSELLVEDITGSTPTRGEVYAVGDEVTKVEVGDEVFFKQYAGIEVEIANRKMLIFQESDLLMVWR